MTIIQHRNFEIKFTQSDIINPDDCIYQDEYNPHNKRPWLLHDHGFTIGVVFADSLQEALDIAVDENKLGQYLIEAEDYDDYKVNTDLPTCSFLGNASEPFDVDSMGFIELKPPAKNIFGETAEVLSALNI